MTGKPAASESRWLAGLAAGLLLVGAALAAALAGSSTDWFEPQAPPAAHAPEPQDTTRPATDEGPASPSDDGRTGQAALRRLLPPMPGAEAVSTIGDEVSVQGLPMNLATFDTDKSTEAILTFYAQLFRRNGWGYAGVEDTKSYVGVPALSATLEEDDLQLSVMVLPRQKGHGNTVILGLADMRGLLQQPSSGLEDFPIYPGTEPMAMRSQDGEVQSLSVSLRTSDALERVEQFYREQFAARGYRPGGDSPAEGSPRQLTFRSSSRRWHLTLSRHEDATAVTGYAVSLHVEEAMATGEPDEQMP